MIIGQVSEALTAAGEVGMEAGFNYSVPTGNFGDVLAGFYAKRMGLPVGKLVVAVNENDILHRWELQWRWRIICVIRRMAW